MMIRDRLPIALALLAAPALGQPADAPIPDTVRVALTATLPAPAPHTRGIGLVLFDTAEYPRGLIPPDAFTWDEPNAPYTVAIALDTHNPPPTDTEITSDAEGKPKYPMGWFDEHGNWYDRPQRELSVHVDGTEVHNILCPVEFRTGQPINLTAELRFVTGAALLDVSIDGTPVLDDHPLLAVRPFRAKARAGSADAVSTVAEPTTEFSGSVTDAALAKPHRVRVFDARFVHMDDRTPATTADFAGIPDSVERVVATLTLAEPEVGYDHWDKKGVIYLWAPPTPSPTPGQSGEPRRFELLRFITPFRKGWTWRADVTHLLPLLRDQRTLGIDIGTYMKGWLLTLDLNFYAGTPERTPLAVVPLWTGEVEIGNPDNPPSNTFADRTVEIPPGATHAAVYVTATGHGMDPNTDNAGEFMPLGRTLTARTQAAEIIEHHTLWNEDVYLNPCRPQRGTWKFDRAGWAPGSLVLPWRVDVSSILRDHPALTITYELDPYLNEGRGQTWAPHHWTDAIVVFSK